MEELADPLADRSAVIVPELVIVPPLTSMKVPLLVATLVTVPSYWSVLAMVTVEFAPPSVMVIFVPAVSTRSALKSPSKPRVTYFASAGAPPEALPVAAEVNRPWASTVIFAFV